MFSWMRFFITNKNGAESSKLLKLFFHALILMRLDVLWYIPGCVVSHRPRCGTHQASANTFPHVSLFTKVEDSAKMIPARFWFWWTCFCPFLSIANSSFDRIYPRSNHFVRSGFWPNYVSSAVFAIFHTVPKHLDSCSNFHEDEVTSRALSWHYVSSF